MNTLHMNKILQQIAEQHGSGCSGGMEQDSIPRGTARSPGCDSQLRMQAAAGGLMTNHNAKAGLR